MGFELLALEKCQFSSSCIINLSPVCQEPVEVYAAAGVQLLLEDLQQQLQPQAAHRQRPRTEPRRCM